MIALLRVLVAALAVAAPVVLGLRAMAPDAAILGHDWEYFLPYLALGNDWIARNGWLAAPHFTAAFCGGMPWLGNPQSTFYSPAQVFAWAAAPAAAPILLLAAGSLLGLAGFTLLLWRGFRLSLDAALFGGAMFACTSLLASRLIPGHAPYYLMVLVPWIAFSALAARGGWRRLAAGTAGVALALSMLIYGGGLQLLLTIMIASSAIVALGLAAGGPWRGPVAALLLGGIWSLAIALPKVAPMMAFALSHPRPTPPELFASARDVARTLLRSLLAPGTLPDATWLGGPQGGRMVGRHEFDNGLPWVAVVAIVLGAAVAIGRPVRRVLAAPVWLLAAAVAVAAPVALTFGTPEWAAFLFRAPVVNMSTIHTRTWMTYLLVAIVLAAIGFQLLAAGRSRRVRAAVLLLGTGLAAGQLLARDAAALRDYVHGEPYAVAAFPLPVPPVVALSLERGAPLNGQSPIRCYEPLFGYRLETFPSAGLVPGPIRPERDGEAFNLADPRCMVGRTDRSCRSGDRFQADEAEDAAALAAHRPLRWAAPPAVRAAPLVAAVALAAAAAALLLPLARRRRARSRA